MRFVSSLAIGLMLSLAGTAVATAPAIAKEKPAKPVKRSYSKGFMEAAQPLEKATQAKDGAAMKAAIPTVEAAVANADDKFALGQYKLNAGIMLSEAALQRQGIEDMLASGATPAADLSKYTFFAGDFAMKAQDYDAAIAHFQKAIELGYPGSGPYVLGAEANFQKAVAASGGGGQLTAPGKPYALAGLPLLKRAIELEKAGGAQVPASWYARGFNIAYLAGSPDAPTWAKMQLQADPSARNWRSLLRSFQDSNKQMSRGENLDVMRLMGLTGALESEYDYSEYADAASKSGLLGEVKSVIDQGRSSGKLGAGKLQDFYQQATGGIAADKASLPAAERDAAKAANGRTAAFTGDAYLGYGDYAKAVTLYNLALEKGSVDAAEISTRIGIALAKSGDLAGAKTAFEKVPTGGARGEVAQFWLLYLTTKGGAA